jgi:hypothetical protein
MASPASWDEGRGLSRPDDARRRNARIAATARARRFDRATAVPFICECSEPTCEELIRLTLTQFATTRAESDYVVASGHEVDAGRIVRVRDGIWFYRVESRALETV